MSNAIGVVIAGVLVAGASGSVAGAQAAPRESKAVPRPAAAKALPGMARIPAGCFAMGDAFKEGVANEVPVHRVCLTKAFEVDVHEVTNAEYKACVDARRCSAPGTLGSKTRPSYHGKPQYGGFPVVHVDWNQARAYCTWAGKRLPSEAEWEYAARGGLAAKRYPRGDSLSCADANYGRAEGSACRGHGGLPDDTHAVGSHAANGYGLHDMAGNVWEWVNDGYSESYYGESPVNDPPGPAPDYPVVRGGAWSGPPNYLRVAYRGNYSPTLQDDLIGFRCAR